MQTLTKLMNETVSPDRALQGVMVSLIRLRAAYSALGRDVVRWRPGEPLKILMAGYLGTRNTGADVRVEEMVRQFRHLLGDRLELTMITLDAAQTAGYFQGARQVVMPKIFPRFLFDECPRHHGVVACEGSMFKSKFADALTVFMAGALGMASAENKLSVGYGAEAGEMNPRLAQFVQKHCRSSFIICRNEPSRQMLQSMGIRAAGGTDTAWTFDPGPLARGARYLREAGWDGTTPVLAVCPINPFWWPVKPNLWKAGARHLLGRYRDEHYSSIYFHEWSREIRAKYARYLDGLARAISVFRKEEKVFPVLIGMERLDRKACQDLAARLDPRPPLFVSDTYDMYEMVSVLRNASYVLSSRYHAVVTSMPALVPSAGVTMDERIRNLMAERGHEHLLLEVDDEPLGERLVEVLRTLRRDSERISAEIGRAIPGQLKKMGEMGLAFVDEVHRVYPELPRREIPRTWEHHLPPLSPDLQKVLEAHA